MIKVRQVVVWIVIGLVSSLGGCKQANKQRKGPAVQLDQSRANSQSATPERIRISREDLAKRALQGCDWLADVSQVLAQDDPSYGAMKGEYDTRSRKWAFYGPFWHTGQAVRVLLMAYQDSGKEKYLKHAVLGGEYMTRHQIKDKSDKLYGFVHGREIAQANTASQVENFMALYDLYKVTKDPSWRERFHLALDWVAKNAYLDGQGLFYNHYEPATDSFAPVEKSRPTNDDAVFGVGYREFNDPRYLKIFLETADRLLREEDPPGNWMKYPPCRPDVFDGQGRMHPRHAWWWGYPMLTAYDLTGDKKYLDAAVRAAQWYIDNNNLDGGYYYNVTKSGGKHLSFDFCTSAVGCAMIMWIDLWKRTGEEKYLKEIETSLGFLLRCQLRDDVEDPAVRGAFFEGMLPPDGTLAPGFYFRDIATIYSVRAMLELMRAVPGDIHYLQY
ncbi:MAG: hypothetical protein ACE15E_17310 [Acidobacteriota bacterium]